MRPPRAPSAWPWPLLLAYLALCACATTSGVENMGMAVDREVIGASVGGQPIRARTFGGGRASSGRVYVIAGIHGDERPAVENGGRLAGFLEAEASAGLTIRLVEDMNPDGTQVATRFNSRGVDLNRNWPASNFTPHSSRGEHPLSEPEALSVHTDLTRFGPDLVLVLHAARRGPFVNYDGPARAEAESFADAAARIDPRWKVIPDMGYATLGSMGSWLGRDQGIPILTVELRRGDGAGESWPALRAGLLGLFGAGAGALSYSLDRAYRVE